MKSSDLNTIIGVIYGSESYIDITTKETKKSRIGNYIGVITVSGKYPYLINVSYPLSTRSYTVGCGSTCFFNIDKKLKVRPATEEEIARWRHADGVGKTARRLANTADKVKDIKWVNVHVDGGDSIIVNL